LVNHAAELEGLRDSTFVSIQQRSTFGTIPAPLIPTTPILRVLMRRRRYTRYRAEYRIPAGANREIIVQLVRGKDATYEEPALTVPTELGFIAGPFMDQHASGVQAVFRIQLRRSFERAIGMVSVRIPKGEVKEGDYNAAVRSSEVSAYVTSIPPWLWLILTLASLTLGLFLTASTAATLSELAEWLQLADPTKLRNSQGLVNGLAKAAGVLLLLTGYVILVGKLPVK
jgi:hypothetical protein